MKCSCGTTNAANAKFCKGCGEEIKKVNVITPKETISCPACNAGNKPGVKFCASCGHSMQLPETEPLKVKPLLKVAPVRTQKLESVEMPVLEEDVISSAGVGSNKKVLITAAFALFVIAGAALTWSTLHKPDKSSAVDSIAVSSTPLTIVPEASKHVQEPQPTNVLEPAVAPKAVASLASNYIGQTVKYGIKDKYYVSLLDQSQNMIVLKLDDENLYSKMILVTNKAGKVLDGKDVLENNRKLTDGKTSCVLNQKPYPGIYAAVAVDQMTVPSAIWKLSETGMLIEQVVTGIQCGVFESSDGEDTEYIGYNVKDHQPNAIVPTQSKTKHEIKTLKTESTSLPAKPTPSKNEKKVSSPIAPQVSSTQKSQQQEPIKQQETIKQDEPLTKQINNLGGLFEKLGESVKKGETTHICSSSERAMNQCQ